MSTEGLTEQIADLILEKQKVEFSQEAVHQFKRALLDYLASSIAGAQEPVVKSIIDYVETIDNKSISSITAHTLKFSPPNAALINGTCAHSLDFDDGHTEGSIHLGGVIFPAVISISEQYGYKNRDIIQAVIIGYEVGGRLAAALHPNVWKRGFHNTPVIGIFGAVASLSVLFGFEKNEIINALGIAGSFSGGLFEFLGEGADVKRVHSGKAARDAIVSVELAKRGITGPKKVFEGTNGFIKAFSDNQINLARLTQIPDNNYEILNIYFKPYPCCRHLHGPIEAIKNIGRKTNINKSDIESIQVGTYQVASKHNHSNIDTLLDAQMSIPCVVALALINDDVSLELFNQEHLKNPEVQSLIRKTNVYVDDECQEKYPQNRPVKLSINFINGTKIIEYIEDPKGESSYPLTDKELELKLLNNCKRVLPQKKLQTIITSVWNFDTVEDLEFLT